LGMFAVVLVSVFLLIMSVSMLISGVPDDVIVVLVSVGLCLAPGAALVTLLVLLRRLPADAT
jgi:hypothetical protein